MKVLVACEESQRVCIAFRELGHEAYSCDVQDCSGGHPEWHIKDDALKYINGRCSFITCDGKAHEISGKWDLLIAHPPCTYLSNAGACRLYPKKGQLNQERYKNGLKAKEFFMMFYNADCDKIAVENPIPSKIFCLPKYTQTIQPYQYGHPYSKKTCLWLKNLPPLKPTEIISDYTPYLPSGTGRKLKGTSYGAKEQDRNRKVMRSKTFPGIARAMAEQWGGQA